MEEADEKIREAKEGHKDSLVLSLQDAAIPDSVFELNNLLSLEIVQWANISRLPVQNWSGLSALTQLTISNSSLKKIGEEITALVNLRVLHLCHNALSEISVQLLELENLEEFCASHNQLRTLPDVAKWKSLNVLDVSHNKLATLDWLSLGELHELEEAYVSNNRLEVLPPEVGLMHNLLVLDLASNRIEELPLMMGNMVQLQELYLSHNRVVAIPTSFCHLANLRELAIDANPVRTPPMIVCNGGVEGIISYLKEVQQFGDKKHERKRGSLARQKHFSVGEEKEPVRLQMSDDGEETVDSSVLLSMQKLQKVPNRRQTEVLPSAPVLMSPRFDDGPMGSPRISIAKGSGSMFNLFRLTPRERAFTSAMSQNILKTAVDASFEVLLGSLKIFVYKCPDALNPLVKRCEGYEDSSSHVIKVLDQKGNEGVFMEDNDNFACHYQTHFYQRDHANMIGMDADGSIIIVSMTKDAIGSDYLALVRVKQANALTRLPTAVVDKSRFSKKPRARDLLKALRELHPDLRGVNMHVVNDPSICADLLQHEKSLHVSSYKFGVLNAAAGQRTEDEIYSNNSPSACFREFLMLLGETIILDGWEGYSGGLDTRGTNTTGDRSVYTKHFNIEIMFHVAAFLPFEDHNEQQLARKRHIGNDIVVVVFLEGKEPFDPSQFHSHFNHVFILVHPLGGEGGVPVQYLVSVVWKEGVRWFGPTLIDTVFDSGQRFRTWLITKLINAERAAYCAPQFAEKLSRTRQVVC